MAGITSAPFCCSLGTISLGSTSGRLNQYFPFRETDSPSWTFLNSSPVTLGELISSVEEVTGKKVKIEQMPKRKGEMLLTYANIDKARDLLGYNPTTTMKEAIKMYHDWYLKQEDWYRRGSF